MTNAYETSAAASSVRRRNAMRILSDAVQLFWTVTDGYARRRLLLALALVAAGALLAALTPIALKLIVDSLSDKAASGLDSLLPLTLVMLYVIGQYLWRCSSELRMMLHGHAEQRVRRHIGARLFEHLVRLPLQFHLERKTGAMGETAEQGIRGYQLLLHHLVYTILPVTIELGMVAVVMLYFGHQIYLLILGASAIAYAAAFYHGSLAVHQSAERVASSHIEAHALLTDSLINHETVKYFDAEPVVCHRYDAALSRSESAWRRFFSSRAVNGLLVATIFAMSLGFSLVYAASDVARGIITVGDFVLVNAYIVRVVQPLEMLGSAVRDIAQGVAFLGSMLALFREKTEGGEGAVTSLAQKTRGELAFVGVSFSYRQERVVLSNVSLVVPAGKTVAVVGVSGSGKSSLIRLLFRLYEPDSGRILLDGTPISELSLSAVRRAIAVVPQDTVLFHDTIGRNIAFGRFGATQYEIEEAARVANLHDFILALPEGYETLVGERGLKLSGGERQRVAIARAALKRPRIFVFDEATSSLDSKTEREILRNLVDLSSRSTTLVIAHRLSTVVHADEILVLDHGIIVERGTHDGLRAVKGHYAALWNAQQSGAHGRGEAHASIT